MNSALQFPLAVALASAFVVGYLGFNVGQKRRLAKIPYPNMYATKEEAEKDIHKLVFNCAQRSHQHTLENYPSFLIVLAIASIDNPFNAGIFGTIYLLGRLAYASGYTTGDPSKRHRGSFGYIGLLGLIYHSVVAIYKLK